LKWSKVIIILNNNKYGTFLLSMIFGFRDCTYTKECLQNETEWIRNTQTSLFFKTVLCMIHIYHFLKVNISYKSSVMLNAIFIAFIVRITAVSMIIVKSSIHIEFLLCLTLHKEFVCKNWVNSQQTNKSHAFVSILQIKKAKEEEVE
jgi:hypothetical protein